MKMSDHQPGKSGLLERVDAERHFTDPGNGEAAWIEVIQKMDEVYAIWFAIRWNWRRRTARWRRRSALSKACSDR